MVFHAETIHLLRRILYITTSLFIIFGLTSIGILVDAARKDRPVVLATALILLSILLAFLLIFLLILLIWRNANQHKRWRQERDVEARWLPSPNGTRYLPTHQELRSLRRQEKRERRDRAGQRSIQNAIAAARGRISAPKDPRDGDTGRRLEREKASQQFVARPDPIFGHGRQGIFGARPGLGGGLNPNHGLSPPTSPKSPARSLPRGVAPRNVIVPKATVWKPCYFVDGYGYGLGADADKIVAHRATEENGQEVSEKEEGAVAPLDTEPYMIVRKEVGTPPRGGRGALMLVNEGVGDVGKGAVIGVAGERVTGVGNERLPSKLVGHGLMAIPPPMKAAQQQKPWQEGTGPRWSGRDSWSRQKGSFADMGDSAEGVPWAEKIDTLRNSWKSPDMFGAMTADEVQAEMKKAKCKAGQGKNVRPDAVTGKAGNALTRNQEKSGNHGHSKREAEELERGNKKARVEKQKKRKQVNDERTRAAALPGSKREQAEKEAKQAMDRTAEEEQRLRDQTVAQSADHEGRRRKSSETYPMPHLEAIPSRLTIRCEKKEESGHLSAVRGAVDDPTGPSAISKTPDKAEPAPLSYDPYIAYKIAPATTSTNYHPTIVQEEDETDWQAHRRAQDLSRRNEEEAARLAIVRAFASPSPPPPPPSPLQSPASPTGTFSDWHRLYKKDAKERGVRGFTCTTSTTEMEKNEGFESFEDIERERQINARRGEVELVGTSGQIGGVPSSGSILDTGVGLGVRAIDTPPSQRKVVSYGMGMTLTADEAQAQLERMPVRSLHSTERGTVISSFQGKPSGSTAAAKEWRSGIPRRTAGSAVAAEKTVEIVESAATSAAASAAATTSRPRPLPGQFGYQNTRKGNADLARRKARKGKSKADSGTKKTGLSEGAGI